MEIARHWRLKEQRYSLVGEQCPHCETLMFPPRDICIDCGGLAKGTVQEVYSSKPKNLAPKEEVPQKTDLPQPIKVLPVEVYAASD